jgi:hypothetical protein
VLRQLGLLTTCETVDIGQTALRSRTVHTAQCQVSFGLAVTLLGYNMLCYSQPSPAQTDDKVSYLKNNFRRCNKYMTCDSQSAVSEQLLLHYAVAASQIYNNHIIKASHPTSKLILFADTTVMTHHCKRHPCHKKKYTRTQIYI